jgi:hypothetical protein
MFRDITGGVYAYAPSSTPRTVVYRGAEIVCIQPGEWEIWWLPIAGGGRWGLIGRAPNERAGRALVDAELGAG